MKANPILRIGDMRGEIEHRTNDYSNTVSDQPT